MSLLHRLEILPKVGSILLLLTGIAMAILEPSLFKAGWFIASIVIYLAVQVIVVGILPKQMNKQLKIVNAQKGENLPESYKQLSGCRPSGKASPMRPRSSSFCSWYSSLSSGIVGIMGIVRAAIR